jgi:type 1 fimbria pilin
MMIQPRYLIILIVHIILYSSVLSTRIANAEQNLSFKGTVIEPPPCEINDSQQIDINFGASLGIDKVDGHNYRQTINYLIKCDGESPSSNLTLTVIGNAMSIDNSAIQSSTSGLGIRILESNRPLTLNQALVIDASNPPVLEAVPIADPAIQLKEGSFVATASLLAEYD